MGLPGICSLRLTPLEPKPEAPTFLRRGKSVRPEERMAIGMETLENILVARAQSGSEDAFTELARRHSSQIYNCSLRILKSPEDAEDNLQNVLLQTFCTINRCEGKSQFSTWLVRVNINEALIQLWKRQRDKFAPLQDASHFLGAAGRRQKSRRLGRNGEPLLIKKILRLSPGRRNEILRFTMEEKRNKSTHKSTRFRALHQLRNQLSSLRSTEAHKN